MEEFKEFPKIYRWSRDIIVTEKIDGTNACVDIGEDGSMRVGSRTRWITPDDDNHGFVRWAREHETELVCGLGIGTHYGEWWGPGIQRGYGQREKRFSLFNTTRWDDSVRPACCHVVPTLYAGTMSESAIEIALDRLRSQGSYASPGFMRPEGIVIFHVPSRTMFKKTIEIDEEPKNARR